MIAYRHAAPKETGEEKLADAETQQLTIKISFQTSGLLWPECLKQVQGLGLSSFLFL